MNWECRCENCEAERDEHFWGNAVIFVALVLFILFCGTIWMVPE